MEIAFVIAIVGLLLGAFLVPLTTQIQANRVKETQRQLEEIKEALIGYAVSNNGQTLPCPDQDFDGVGETTCSTASDREGNLPWKDLGLPPTDAWGRVFRYAVAAEFTLPTSAGAACDDAGFLGLCDAGDLTVTLRDDNRDTVNLVESAPAVVMSMGPNGYGATDIAGNAIDVPAEVGDDEKENFDPATTAGTFMTRSVRTTESADCEDGLDDTKPLCAFDDIVIWLSGNVILNRLVTAGKLP